VTSPLSAPGTTLAARARKQVPDAACAEAVDAAREAAETAAPGEVGEHVGVEAEGERVVTHRFACLNTAYRGWAWAVTVARASRAKNVTINEVVLLPGSDSVLPPPWVPWSERLVPGDLGPGDIIPTPEDDDRLEPGLAGSDDLGEEESELGLLAAELGLARPRVLSPIGRDDALDRWYSGDRGPESPLAQAAPAACSTCGFLLIMAGSVGRVFGVCANANAPDDGRVVSYDHGCGAHSEALAAPPPLAERPPPVLDELRYDDVEFDAPGEPEPVPDLT
jgi:hypothetical protein